MRNFKLLFSVTVLLVISSNINAQENYYGYSNTLISIDYDNNGFVDDLVGINTSENTLMLTLWKNNNNSYSKTKATLSLPGDIENIENLKGKVVAGDFDNDGFIDDIAAIYEIGLNKTSIIVWIKNKESYTASQWWYGGDFDANQTVKTIVCGDFDNDGFKDDIAAFYDYQNDKTKVFVWKSDKEKFNWPGTWWIGNDFNAANIKGKIVVGDFDHDGFIDDIAALYDYSDQFCKIFIWPSTGKNFTWPQTWYQQANFNTSNVNGNVIAGDFNKNGFVDNIAAFYRTNENQSEILVWEKSGNRFKEPNSWWYGMDEAITTNNRLVAFDSDANGIIDQFSGLYLKNNKAKLTTWTANNNHFETPQENWDGIALSALDCEKYGKCLPNSLSKDLLVYPNPAYESLSITIPTTNDTYLHTYIYNSLGSIIYQCETECNSILEVDLTEFEAGNYLVHIKGNESNYREKLIIK